MSEISVHSEHYFNLAFQKVIDKVVLTEKRKVCFPSIQEKILRTWEILKKLYVKWEKNLK